MSAAYTLDRAAALAGVPRSTVHLWATNGLLVPSVSPERVRLWSYSDLMGLRVIDWLRRAKESPRGSAIPRSSMTVIKRALDELRRSELDLWDEAVGPSLSVDLAGRIYVMRSAVVASRVVASSSAQHARTDLFDVVAPFTLAGAGRIGPDLRNPRPQLRILPGKLAGAPHVVDTRVDTLALSALSARKMSVDQIVRFYPTLERGVVREALELEEQLKRNLAA